MDLSGVSFVEAFLTGANLAGANLSMANLIGANLYRVDLSGANLTSCSIYGISAWDVTFDEATITKRLDYYPLQRTCDYRRRS